MSAQSLLLIDGHNVARRVYEAAKRSPSNKDAPEAALVAGAMRSSLQSIRRALDETPTTHALAVFDAGGQNWRHRLYPAYKEGRTQASDEFKAAIPELMAKIEGILGVQTVAVPDVEADDVIATVFKRWRAAERGEAVILSTDKDLTWLMWFGAQVRNHFDSVYVTPDDIEARYGVEPRLILDWLALAGDKTDGVPGLHGCGEKTATKWLIEYGSLAGLYENADKVKGKIGEKLRAGIEDIRLSRLLVSFKTDVRCGLTFGALARQ